MSYIGLNPQQTLLNTSTQFFSGNSVATQFNLNRSIASASDLDVIVGNVLKVPFTDYIAGNVVLIFATPPASGSDNIAVTYRAGALNSLDLISANAFGAGTVGAPSVYSVAANNSGLYWSDAQTVIVTTAGANRATFSANIETTSSTTGALRVTGGAGITGNLHTNGQVVVGSTSTSTSITTGALLVAGGVGVVGNINVGGGLTCVGDFVVNGNFTTTGVDSLAVADPFIFLAANNPGDTFDTGIVAQYYDGSNTRYNGLFRDVTDAKYKLFTNLLTAPTTVVDTTDPSFQLTDLVLANVSATGNVDAAFITGNGYFLTGIAQLTTTIFNSNSAVNIPTINGNIFSNVNNVNIVTVSSSGLAVTGAISGSTTASITGNIVAGNVNAGNTISAAGNITTFTGNVSAGNALITGLISAAGNITGGNIIGTTAVSTGGNVTGLNIKTGGFVSAAGDVFASSINLSGNLNVPLDASVTGNVIAGNVLSSGIMSATGNILAPYFIGNGAALTGIDATSIQFGNSNVRVVSSAGDVTVTVAGVANIAVFSPLGATIAGTTSAANLSATGTVTFSGTTQNINIGTSQTTGTTTLGGTTQTGTILIGQSTGSQTVGIGNGVAGSGSTKSVHIGENGAAGSTTLIGIGPVTATTAAGTATFNTATTVVIANTGGSALSAAGNISGGNVRTAGQVSAAGTITGGNVSTAGLISATGNITSGNLISLGATSTTGASTAGSYSAAGNITGGNVLTGGLISATGNIDGGNVNTAGLITATGNITSAGNVIAGNLITANLMQAATLSATSNVVAGNLNAAGLSLTSNVVSSLNVTGNVTGGNINSADLISAVGNIIGGNVLGGANVNATTHTGTTVSVTGLITGGNVTATNLTGTLATAAQTNVTSLGTLTALAVSGAITVNSTNAVTAIVNGGTNGVGNIGTSVTGFNTVFAKATTAQYADLAELYAADAEYAPGTVLDFGGANEVTLSIGINSVRVAGVVSTSPAHLMNSTLQSAHTAALALTGRVPTSVVGVVRKGDMMVTAGGGVAQACAEPRMGSVIGKAAQDHSGGSGMIEIVVGRL
jgi:hypothetical protein